MIRLVKLMEMGYTEETWRHSTWIAEECRDGPVDSTKEHLRIDVLQRKRQIFSKVTFVSREDIGITICTEQMALFDKGNVRFFRTSIGCQTDTERTTI